MEVLYLESQACSQGCIIIIVIIKQENHKSSIFIKTNTFILCEYGSLCGYRRVVSFKMLSKAR